MTRNDVQPLEQPARRRLLQAGAAFALSVQFGGLIAKADAAEAERKYGAASMPGGVVDNPLVTQILERGKLTPTHQDAALRGVADRMTVYQIP